MYSKTLKRVLPLIKSLSICIIIIGVLFVGVGSNIFPAAENKTIPTLSKAVSPQEKDSFIKEGGKSLWQNLISSHIPGLKEFDSPKTDDQGKFINLILYALTGVKISEPLNYLESSVPAMAMIPMEEDSLDDFKSDIIDEPPEQKSQSEEKIIENNLKSKEPLVALYCTHTSETYEMTEGITHVKGKAGAVLEVAKTMSQQIEKKFDIKTIVSETLHDTSFNQSYIESEKTVKNLVSENSSLKMLLDIHRDSSLPRERTCTEINGKKYAKILIVVGTDSRAKHPNWRDNLALARKLAAKMDELYPGLSRGISIKKGRYNQQHHKSALLLEVGSINNSTEEALNSANLLADVVVSLLNDMNQEN